MLQDAGYAVSGVMFDMLGAGGRQEGACPKKDVEDCMAVAAALGISCAVVDLAQAFRQQVMRFFADQYIRGETPNPCVECNKTIKFPYLVRYADETGGGMLATGHYARTQKDAGTGRTLLLKAKSLEKDQSYMLYNLPQETLARLIFPLGEYSKEQVREIARAQRLVNFKKSDSQDICFIPDGNYPGFIATFTGYQSIPGDFVSEDGQVLGRHKGLCHYTVGRCV